MKAAKKKVWLLLWPVIAALQLLFAAQLAPAKSAFGSKNCAWEIFPLAAQSLQLERSQVPQPQRERAPPAAKIALDALLGPESETLRLPPTMIDELPAYQQAADQGLLVKTQSSTLPPSSARAVWEAANGPVPDGFDVDHIIQRQFGGTDDLANLQLKVSGLNRSEGAQAMWLNKSYSYGTIFGNVELVPPK
jgi:hypothetical protein